MQISSKIGTTEAQIDLLDVAEKFCRDKSSIENVRKLIDDSLGYDPDVWKQIGELGWLAVAIPEGYDGVGLSLTEIVPIAEQMGHFLLNSPFLSTSLAAQALIAGGTNLQKQTWLPKIAAGHAATIALCEDNGDWDLNNIEGLATQFGNQFILSGTKMFVLDLTSAELVITSIKKGNETRLVALEQSQIPESAVRRERIIDDVKRSYELCLDGIEVSEGQFFSPELTQSTLAHIHLVANLLGAAELCGACKATIDYTVEYLKTRKQFDKLIGSYQALKHPTVDAFVLYQQARSLLYGAAIIAENTEQGEIAMRMAKAHADKALSFAADRSIQFHGGFGFTYDCDAQLYRRRALFHASQYGDAAYHKKKLANLLF